MATTISPPVRIAAIVGILVAAGLGGALFLLGRSADPATLPPPPAHVTQHVAVSPAQTRVTHKTPPHATLPHEVQTHGARTPRAQTHRARTQAARQLKVKPRPTTFRTPASGFPSAVDRAFRTHRVVVLVVYMPGAGVDALVRKEARAGASATGAGFVQVSALNNAFATEVLAKTGVLAEPAVVVLRRPGTVVATLGVADRETVVQAVAQAKR